jgi:hypothetical protein
MPHSDVERLARLEAEMSAVQGDVSEIKDSIKALEKIAAQGGGAFNAILMVGGLIGWLFGIGAAIYSFVRH